MFRLRFVSWLGCVMSWLSNSMRGFHFLFGLRVIRLLYMLGSTLSSITLRFVGFVSIVHRSILTGRHALWIHVAVRIFRVLFLFLCLLLFIFLAHGFFLVLDVKEWRILWCSSRSLVDCGEDCPWLSIGRTFATSFLVLSFLFDLLHKLSGFQHQLCSPVIRVSVASSHVILNTWSSFSFLFVWRRCLSPCSWLVL